MYPLPLASLPRVFSSHIPTREPVHWLDNSLCQIGSLNLARRFSLLSTLHLNRQKMLYSSWLILLRLAIFTSLQSSHTYVESRQRGGGGGGRGGSEGGTQQNFIRGDSPGSNCLPFYIPFLTKKVPLSYTFHKKWHPLHKHPERLLLSSSVRLFEIF